MSELFKLVQIENSKRKRVSTKQKRAEKAKEKQVQQEVKKKVEVIRKKKKAEKSATERNKSEKPKPILKVGDRVRMEDGRAIGSIDKIEKNKAVVNYGMFTTNVSLDQLELVEAVKK